MERSMAANPVLFSSHFGISGAALGQMNVIDPILNFDLPYFIDPLLLSGSSVPEMTQASATYEDFFRKVVSKLQSINIQGGSTAWDEALEMLTFPEIDGVGLGYGVNSSAGSGMGIYHAKRLLSDAQDIVRQGYFDPNLFAVVMLLGDKIGADKISDMTSGIIQDHLMELSQRVSATLRLPTQPFVSLSGKSYDLVENPLSGIKGRSIPVLFIPDDIIRPVPVSGNFKSIYNSAVTNQTVRDTVSSHLGGIFKSRSDDDRRNAKKSMRDAVFNNVALIPDIVKMIVEVNNITPNGRLVAGSVSHLVMALEAIKSTLSISQHSPSFEDDVVKKACEIVGIRSIGRYFLKPDRDPKPVSECRILLMLILGYVLEANSVHNSTSMTVSPIVPTTGRTSYVCAFMPNAKHMIDFRTHKTRGFFSDFIKYSDRMDADQTLTYHYILLDVGQQGQQDYDKAANEAANRLSAGRRPAALYHIDL